MDNQQIFNFVVAIAAFLAVFVFNQTTRKIQKLEDDANTLRERILQDYVQKDDYKSDIAEIKTILRQIFDKLDSKQDKWNALAAPTTVAVIGGGYCKSPVPTIGFLRNKLD